MKYNFNINILRCEMFFYSFYIYTLYYLISSAALDILAANVLYV